MTQVNAPPTPRDREIRRELAELAERQGFVHHVADAASGRIVTTMLDRPPAPLSRAERLSQLGHLFDPSTRGALPAHAARSLPSLAAELAHDLRRQMWRGPTARIMCIGRCRAISPSPDAPDPPVLRAYFGAPPAGRCVATLRFAAVLGEARLFSPHTDDRDDHPDLLPASDDGEMAVRQCRSNLGRGVPRTAIVPTTSSHNGSTPKPGLPPEPVPATAAIAGPTP